MITVMLGPMLPALSARWSLNDTQSGYLITAQFLGSLLGTVSSGFVASRFTFRSAMLLGVALMAFGAATLVSHGYFWGAVAVFCSGTGIGITVPTCNLVVARTSGQERSSSLNLLNFFWSAGAVSCPFLLAVLPAGQRLGLLLAGLVGFLGLVALALLAAPIRMPESASSPEGAPQFRLQHVRTTVVLLFGTLFFVYVGTESALGDWLASYAKRAAGEQGGGWVTVPAYFYGALLVGRLVGSRSLKRIPDLAQARLGAVLAAGGVAALLYSGTLTGIAVAATLVGLGMSTLYPIAIGLASAGLGTTAVRVMGTLFALSTLGGACIPWLVGYVSTRFGSLRVALLVPLAGCAAIAVLFCNPLPEKCQSDS